MSSSADQQRSQPPPKGDDWLLSFVGVLEASGPRVLEVGCGPGRDAATLSERGFEVVAFDRLPLLAAAERAPKADFLRADVSSQLPFRDGVFNGAVASLSLHYLPWEATRQAFSEIRRVVREGGAFAFRVNADDDVNHGAGEGEELERGFFSHPETVVFRNETILRRTDGMGGSGGPLRGRTARTQDDPPPCGTQARLGMPRARDSERRLVL